MLHSPIADSKATAALFAGFRRPTARALVGTLLGLAPGFLLPFAITTRMHVGHLTDAYAYAFGIALFASTIFAGVLQTNALPVLQQVKHYGRARFLRRLRRIAIQTTAVANLAYLLIAVVSVAYAYHQTHWTAGQRHLLFVITCIFMVLVVTSAINGALAAGMNALGSFLTPAASQALKSGAPLVAIIFVTRNTSGIIIIAALIAAGELCRTLMLAYQLWRADMGPFDDTGPVGSQEPPLWRFAAPVALSSLITAGSPLIDRSIAAKLSAGSVTYVDLGEKVFQVPQQIVVTSLVLIAGTYWADIRRTDVPRLRRHISRTMRRGGLVCIALLCVMLMMLLCVAILAGPRLAGGSTSTLLTIIALLLLGLPPAFIMACGARLLTATQTTYLLPGLGIIYFAANLGFDVAGAKLMGVAGISLSSTLCRWISALLYLVIMHRLLQTEFQGLGVLSRRKRLMRSPSSTTVESGI